MDESEFDRKPNPFSAFAQPRGQARRQLASTAKVVLLSVALFCVITAVQMYLQRARLAEIINGFSGRTTAEKIDDLHALQATGIDGLPGLVSALGDSKAQVSETAAGILLDLHRQWMTLPNEQLSRHRLVFAEELAKVTQTFSDPADPRLGRVQELARLAARDLIDWGCPVGDPVYQRLMQVIAAAPAAESPIATHDSDATPSIARSAPLDLVEHTAASWTDWPPTASTPTLYRRGMATVDSIDSVDASNVVLNQRTSTDDDLAAARLLRPQFQPATSLIEQSSQRRSTDAEATEYWVRQLDSLSVLVRLSAVTELAKRGDEQSLDALRIHLEREPEDRIIQQINHRLSR